MTVGLRLRRRGKEATFRFYEELSDYLPETARKRDLPFRFGPPVTIKEAVLAFGVPPDEVDLVLVNGESVGLTRRLRNGDRVSVYPIFERFDITGVTKVRKVPLKNRY